MKRAQNRRRAAAVESDEPAGDGHRLEQAHAELLRVLAAPVRRPFHLLSAVSSLLIIGAVAVSSYWAFLDRSVPAIVTRETVLDTDASYPGGAIVVHRDYCVFYPENVVVQREIVGRQIYQLPSVALNGPVGCYSRDFNVWLPFNIAAGDYLYSSRLIFYRNPIQQTVEVDLGDVAFKVQPGPAK